MSSQHVFPYGMDNDSMYGEGSGEAPSTMPKRKSPPPVVHAISTVPSGTHGDGRALIGALAFMEGVATNTMGIPDLLSWFDEFLVRPGYMPVRPLRVSEPSEGSVFLGPVDAEASLEMRNLLLNKVVRAARKRVLETLRGLLTKPGDDRFLFMLAASGRVWPNRASIERTWCIGPHPADSMSEIVLALFAADILSNRQLYARNLCVCATCGRISFRENPVRRERCKVHDSSTFGSILRIFK